MVTVMRNSWLKLFDRSCLDETGFEAAVKLAEDEDDDEVAAAASGSRFRFVPAREAFVSRWYQCADIEATRTVPLDDEEGPVEGDSAILLACTTG